jgi:hypothetical protein
LAKRNSWGGDPTKESAMLEEVGKEGGRLAGVEGPELLKLMADLAEKADAAEKLRIREYWLREWLSVARWYCWRERASFEKALVQSPGAFPKRATIVDIIALTV